MEDNIREYIQKGDDEMAKTVQHLQENLRKIRAGKASPSMLHGIMVDYYGNSTPLAQVANIIAQDSKTIAIQPWEKSMLAPIEKSIFGSNLGVTPMNDGEMVRIIIPPLTEERRKALVKQSKMEGDDGKQSLRHTRHKLMDFVKKEIKDGYPEDAGKRREAEVEDIVKRHYEAIDKIVSSKEKEILTV